MSELNSSATISVSSKNMDCRKLANLMRKHGIICSVTPNISVVGKNLENGCQIRRVVTTREEIKTTWGLIKEEFGLNCAHIYIPDKYQGCILKF